MLNYKSLQLVATNNNYGEQEEYNSFTNIFDTENIAIDKYFSLVFSDHKERSEDEKGPLFKIQYHDIVPIKPFRTKARLEFEIQDFSGFIDDNRCIYGQHFLMKSCMWQISAMYTTNCNLSFYLHLCESSLNAGESFSIRASVKPLEINENHYSCNDLFEKTLEGEYTELKKSNGFSKYYFSNVV